MAKKAQIETIARGVLIADGRVLLCRNRRFGHVFLPGGHVEFGESAAAALEREIREELGWLTQVGRFLGACEAVFEQRKKNGGSRGHHEINLVFELSPLSDGTIPQTPTSQEEHIEFFWASLEKLASDSPTVDLLPSGIAMLVAGAQNLRRSASDSESRPGQVGWVSSAD